MGTIITTARTLKSEIDPKTKYYLVIVGAILAGGGLFGPDFGLKSTWGRLTLAMAGLAMILLSTKRWKFGSRS